MTTIDTSIIISTYNSPEWLAKVLHGYNNQTYRLFEIVIADDGSKQETIDLIEEIRKEVFYPIVHVWHEDNGFQKSQILNKAIVKCSSTWRRFEHLSIGTDEMGNDLPLLLLTFFRLRLAKINLNCPLLSRHFSIRESYYRKSLFFNMFGIFISFS